MQIAEYILSALASILGMVSVWYVSGKATSWLQKYRSWRQVSELAATKKTSQDLNQSANAESDALKKIDGR